MSRPIKQGLDYYKVDSDHFQDRKIRRLIRNFSGKGYLIYSYLRNEIYRDKGYFLEWDKDTAFDVSEVINVSENLVDEVMNYCCTVGLFDKELLTNESVLTSKSIQERWSKIVADAKRTVTEIDSRFDLTQLVTGLIKEEKEFTTEESQFTTGESTHSIEQYSIEQDSTYTFDLFWEDYDKKLDRKKAQAKWNKVKEPDRVLIQDFIPVYKAYEPNREFRKNPTTFLNSEIWKEDWSQYPPKQQGGKNGANYTKPAIADAENFLGR